jgi:hypothetical protein
MEAKRCSDIGLPHGFLKRSKNMLNDHDDARNERSPKLLNRREVLPASAALLAWQRAQKRTSSSRRTRSNP